MPTLKSILLSILEINIDVLSSLIGLVAEMEFGYANFGRIPYGSLLVIFGVSFRVAVSFTSLIIPLSAPRMNQSPLITKEIRTVILAQ